MDDFLIIQDFITFTKLKQEVPYFLLCKGLFGFNYFFLEVRLAQLHNNVYSVLRTDLDTLTLNQITMLLELTYKFKLLQSRLKFTGIRQIKYLSSKLLPWNMLIITSTNLGIGPMTDHIFRL